MEENVKQAETGQNPIENPRTKWLFKKGNEFAKMGGRPKGPSIKVWLRNKLAEMDEDERQEFVKDLPKEFLMRMAEGNPKESVEVEEVNNPYAGLTREQKIELIRRNIGGDGKDEVPGGPNLSNGGSVEIPKDGASAQGSGTILETSGNKPAEESGNSSAEKSLENNGNNNSIHNSENSSESEHQDIHNE